jgi:hypothetical protein
MWLANSLRLIMPDSLQSPSLKTIYMTHMIANSNGLLMKKLYPENTYDFLEEVNHFEGGNIENVEFILSGRDSDGNFLHYAEVTTYPEGAPLSCKIKMNNIKSFQFNAKCSSQYFGLSGYPNSLDIIWNDDETKVVIAFGANVSELTYDSLKESEFWIESETIEYEII